MLRGVNIISLLVVKQHYQSYVNLQPRWLKRLVHSCRLGTSPERDPPKTLSDTLQGGGGYYLLC